MAESPNQKTESEKSAKPEKPKQDAAPVQQKAQPNIAVYKDKYFIDLSTELAEFSTFNAKAYSAGTNEKAMEGYYAIICNPRYTPRTNITKNYMKIANPILAKLIAYGRAIMPDGKACYCYIYQHELKKRIFQSDQDISKGWKADRALETLIIPILNCLRDLQQQDITHGNIRATNLYTSGNAGDDKIMLGDCLSVPSSLNQPVVFEPVKRAMADPIGRGEGTIKDDLYALGVLTAMHMRNFDPLRGKTDDEIIAHKTVQGSYAALIGSSDRLSSGITDLLRGLLTDNEKSRWSLEDVFEWLEGRRIATNQTPKLKKAARGLKFDGISFFYPQTLAHKLVQKPQDAVHVIENNELTHWVERSLGDNEMLERVEDAIKSSKEGGTGAGYWDRLLPRVSIALDPSAPIRYKGMSFHLNAIGNTLADAFAQKRGLNNFIEFFNQGIITFWITVSANLNRDVSIYAQQYEKIRGFLRQKGLANGIERCLYFLNPSIHCLSPLVSEHFVTSPAEYLTSLESIAEEHAGGLKWPTRIIDKHATCFLICRDSRLVEPHIYDLSSDIDYRYALANLKVLANIQRFNDVPPLPNLTEWMCYLLKPVVERYHDTETQEKMNKSISKKKVNGDLYELLKLIENPETIKKDQIAYRKAMAKHRELEIEAQKLEQKLQQPKYFSERTGREWAATISGVVSALIIMGFIMVHFGGEGSP